MEAYGTREISSAVVYSETNGFSVAASRTLDPVVRAVGLRESRFAACLEGDFVCASGPLAERCKPLHGEWR